MINGIAAKSVINHLLHPTKLSPKKRVGFTLLSVALGIITFGALHALLACVEKSLKGRVQQREEKNSTEEKVNEQARSITQGAPSASTQDATLPPAQSEKTGENTPEALFKSKKFQRVLSELEGNLKPFEAYERLETQMRANPKLYGIEEDKQKAEVGGYRQKVTIPEERYKEMRPYEDNVVAGISGSRISLPNFRPVIACQAPKIEHIKPFFEMLEQENVRDIVVLLNDKEIKEGKRGFGYWKEPNLQGGFEAKIVETQNPNYQLTHLTKTGEGNASEIRVHHYTAWPDHGVTSKEELFKFIEGVQSNVGKESNNPILIHCSAGIGRTGTLLAVWYQIKNQTNKDALNIPQTVATMRLYRGGMVQAAAIRNDDGDIVCYDPQQLKLIYETVAFAKNPTQIKTSDDDGESSGGEDESY